MPSKKIEHFPHKRVQSSHLSNRSQRKSIKQSILIYQNSCQNGAQGEQIKIQHKTSCANVKAIEPKQYMGAFRNLITPGPLFKNKSHSITAKIFKKKNYGPEANAEIMNEKNLSRIQENIHNLENGNENHRFKTPPKPKLKTAHYSTSTAKKNQTCFFEGLGQEEIVKTSCFNPCQQKDTLKGKTKPASKLNRIKYFSTDLTQKKQRQIQLRSFDKNQPSKGEQRNRSCKSQLIRFPLDFSHQRERSLIRTPKCHTAKTAGGFLKKYPHRGFDRDYDLMVEQRNL